MKVMTLLSFFRPKILTSVFSVPQHLLADHIKMQMKLFSVTLKSFLKFNDRYIEAAATKRLDI